MRTAFVFAVATAAIASTPSEAHWRYTRWGMSPAEVQSANRAIRPGVEPRHSIEGSLVRLSVAHSERGRSFIARFGFDSADRLNTVYLDSQDPSDCQRILRGLESANGAAEILDDAEPAFESRIWPNARGGNYIQTIRIGDRDRPVICSVRYHPRSGPPPESLTTEPEDN